MGKTKKSRRHQKNKKTKQQWHKKGLASAKASEILLKLSAVDPQVDGPSAPSNAAATQDIVVSSTSAEMPRPNALAQTKGFKKFRDLKAKNSPKRLQRKAIQKKQLDREVISKLLSSIKKKYKVQKNPNIKRRLDFRSKESPKKNPLVPKPKFYRPQKIAESVFKHRNDTIEDGEIIEELPSSDDDDCVLLETPNVSINIDDDGGDEGDSHDSDESDDSDDEPCTSDKIFKACQRRAESLTTPKIVQDSNREAALRVKTKSDNEVLYSTITKAEPTINLVDSPERVPSPVADNNDSVIIIEDTIGFVGGEDYIPLPSYSPPLVKGKKKGRSTRLEKKPKEKSGRINDSFFTTAEKKKLGDYNSNTFNPSEEIGETSSKPKTNKRSIIIDGSNVAFAHGNSNVFSSEGIMYCLQYFDKMGHNCKAVVPMFRKNFYKSSNPELLDKLHKEGKIVFTPCKNIPGQMSSSYDDRFILQLAYEWNAAVVSNDNYRDLIDESPAFKMIVENRVLGYTWCDNIFILPKDPYGRWGPKLDEILRC
ncbi:probable ribonuclease ZC3H12C [Drosophila gunungcola]|nr:probable ribonuclease ZC3H12C [Drosophila gunungcola]